jgi:hypothetical protein
MTRGLPKLTRKVRPAFTQRAEAPERAPAGAATKVKTSTSQRKVTQAPAKVGRASVMVKFFRKLIFGKDPKMNCLEAGAGVAPVAVSEMPAQAYPLGRWTLLKRPFVKRSKPAVPAAPVQGELLLDLVRPMRNDLSDSDLEIVRAAPRPGGNAGTAAGMPGLPVEKVPEPVPESGIELAAPRRGITPVTAVEPGPDAAREDPPGVPCVQAGSLTRPEPAAWDRVNEQFFGTGHS